MSVPEKVPESAVVTFPDGIPGLSEAQRFLILRPDGLEPIVMLQSVDAPEVSLPAIPMHAIRADYRLRISEPDRRAIKMEKDMAEIDLVCLAVLVLPGPDHPAACNLAAPIVINPRTRLARQIQQIDSEYPALYPLQEAVAPEPK